MEKHGCLRFVLLVFLLSCIIVTSDAFATRPEYWISRDGHAVALRYGDVWVATMEGTNLEIGKQHGEFAVSEVHLRGGQEANFALPFYGNFIDQVGENATGSRFLGKIFTGTMKWVTRHFRKGNIPQHFVDNMQGLSEGIQPHYSKAIVAGAGAYADDAQVLAHLLFNGNRNFFAKILGIGCSTLLQPKQNGESLIVGRNFDFDGGSYWSDNLLLAYVNPQEPNAQKVLTITSRGIHTLGVNSVNESGVYIDLHQLVLGLQHSGRNVMPIVAITEDVIRHAHTVEEAESILMKYKKNIGGSWAFNIAGPMENGKIGYRVYDLTPVFGGADSGIIRRAVDNERAYAFTNHPADHVRAAEMNARMLNVSPTGILNSYERAAMLQSWGDRNAAQSVDSMVKAIAETWVPNTASSFVVDWETRKVYMVDMAAVMNDGIARFVAVPFPGGGDPFDGVEVRNIDVLNVDDVKAFGKMALSRHLLDEVVPQDMNRALNLYDEALRLFDVERVPANWLMGRAMMLLSAGLSIETDFDVFQAYAIQAIQDFHIALSKTEPITDMPRIGAFQEGMLDDMQKLVSMTWVYVLQQSVAEHSKFLNELFTDNRNSITLEDIKFYAEYMKKNPELHVSDRYRGLTNRVDAMLKFAKYAPFKDLNTLKKHAKTSIWASSLWAYHVSPYEGASMGRILANMLTLGVKSCFK